MGFYTVPARGPKETLVFGISHDTARLTLSVR